MIVFFIFGAVFLLVAIVAFGSMRHARSELHAMIGTQTLPVSDLEVRRSASREVVPAGEFRHTCEVVGTAEARPEGPLQSELSGSPCVWYRFVVMRHYEQVTRSSNGSRNVRRRTETLAETNSWESFGVRDDHGQLIGLDPGGSAVDEPQKVIDQFEPHGPSGGPTMFGVQLPNAFGGHDGTTGYSYQEWIVPQGRRLYVLGEANDRAGTLMISRPLGGGHFIVSTRSEQEVREGRRKRHRTLSYAVLGSALAGLVLIGLGFLA
ncbi:E3 ubiquitin ligase family protein [Saccharopolyspora sp. HNM0983]|uniref:RING-type E3 ubiquitin transferase n=1 Tax=Saccharopolyspora montiporae TaxID=2781240 RepID=A0A929FXV7_9PSEU|nr:E3 ubiquitin ligase family protein [Saccharopolyspora sp. HNM0983]MBE9375066.1 E3 ubiquitin ligase family protein [Saccharopolyspora sp. HNM0983]